MHFTEIGQQLRAYRLESGLRAEEIAARLGVSRAALYRYEKGEVIKLDTIKRLAELLKISPLSLLGIGVEYYVRAAGFFERLRQMEETAEQILLLDGPLCYLMTSDAYDEALAEAFAEAQEQPADATAAEQVLGILAARKRTFQARRPSIICLVSAGRLRALASGGVAGGLPLTEAARRRCRDVAAQEIERVAELMDSEPMGLQFGLLEGTDANGTFHILRARDRATIAVNPFHADAPPARSGGVAMITGADEAINAHQRAAEALWRTATKGHAAAARVRQLLGTNAQG